MNTEDTAPLITDFGATYFSVIRSVNRLLYAYMRSFQDAAFACQSEIEKIVSFDLIDSMSRVTSSNHGLYSKGTIKRPWSRISGILLDGELTHKQDTSEPLSVFVDLFLQREIVFNDTSYYADFAMWISFYGPLWDQHRTWKTSITPVTGTRKYQKKLVIEADGHDFHETKESAAKDNVRDRDMRELGIEVFRFTGSEIYKNRHIVSETIRKFIENDLKELVKENAG